MATPTSEEAASLPGDEKMLLKMGNDGNNKITFFSLFLAFYFSFLPFCLLLRNGIFIWFAVA